MRAQASLFALVAALVVAGMPAPASGQQTGSFGTGMGASRPGTTGTTAGAFSGTAGQNGAATARPGAFGQSGARGFFDSSGLDILGLAGLSAFFSRDATGVPGGALGGALGGSARPGMAGLGMPPGGFGPSPFGPNRDRRFGRESARPPVRTQLRVGFDMPDALPPAVQQRLARTLESAELESRGGIQVTTYLPQADVPMGVLVVLRGEVASAEERMVAEQLVLLDPGVSAVRNELVVAPPTR